MEQPDSGIDVQDVFWRIRQRKWQIILPIVVLFCGAITYLKVTPPVYESYVTVSITSGAQVSPALEPMVRPDQEPRAWLSLIDSRIHSRPFLAGLVARMGLARDPELLLEASTGAKHRPGLTVEQYATYLASTRLSRKIRVTPMQGTLVQIAASDPDPRFANLIVSTIGDVLVEQSKRYTLERAQARGEFSADQMAVYEERLAKAEAALRAFQESQIGRRLSNTVITNENLDQARGILHEADSEIDQIRGRLQSEQVEWRDNAGSRAGPPQLSSTTASALESKLGSLENAFTLATLQEKGETDAANIKTKIGACRQELDAEYSMLARAIPDNLSDGARDAAAGISLDRAILRSLREKRQRLSGQIAEYTRRAESEPRDKLRQQQLEQEVTSSRDLIVALRKEATSSQISQALETSPLGLKLEMVEPPQIPIVPVWPNPVRVLSLAAFLGPLLSFGLFVGLERLGGVVRTAEQAEKEIGATVIGTIPRVEGWSRPGSFLQNHWAALSVLLVLLLTGVFYAVHSAILSNHETPGISAPPKP